MSGNEIDKAGSPKVETGNVHEMIEALLCDPRWSWEQETAESVQVALEEYCAGPGANMMLGIMASLGPEMANQTARSAKQGPMLTTIYFAVMALRALRKLEGQEKR